MHPELRTFLSQVAGAAMLAVASVVFTAFVSIPFALERQPGDAATISLPSRHMT